MNTPLLPDSTTLGAMSLGDRVKAARVKKGWSQAQLAAEVTKAGFKIGQSGIGNIEARGDTTPLCIVQLAHALGVSAEYLQTGRDPAGNLQRASATGSAPQEDVRDKSESNAPNFLDGTKRTLPVWESALGQRRTGAIVVNRNRIAGYLPRPDFLDAVDQAGAVKIHTNEMSPAFEAGDRVMVFPGEPAVANDDVLLVRPRADGQYDVLCRRILKINGDSFRVRQFDPPRDYTVTFDEWPEIWLIVGKYSRRFAT